ncbi:hypothetical protein V1387_12800 [Allomuricauda taeanensis]|uniref:hypothetical protein n=1 Tax=Flagellimonas taeanensis TaxID=1005926 RepID=UPI002E7C4179|nr:hypothetical protein [Allomuricauda taeanensis]MEE1963569.1 hypothetical protein [Allomuricauda taeanensis]
MLKHKDNGYFRLIKIGYFSGDFVKLASTLNMDSMPFIGKEELDQIKGDLRKLIYDDLMANYKDYAGNSIASIDSIGLKIEFDEDESTRDVVIVASITVSTDIWIENKKFGSTSKDHLRLKNNKPLIITYNTELTKYEFENMDQITFIQS